MSNKFEADKQEPMAWDNCQAEKQCRIWCGNSNCVSHYAHLQPKQEPVAWRPILENPIPWVTGEPDEEIKRHWVENMGCGIEYAYTQSQSKRELLTDDEIKQILNNCDNGEEDAEYALAFARAIEAACVSRYTHFL